ncbi:hypothetical protein Ahy_B08g092536 isoform C [Arachis hypogaea]|uniref:Uncharacterized protein n=1 Tax=Arachis hypogaea TaxID=3818 RepID=A0A444Y465_ARAHY|nr:hypothetical protein Ahy_B08g092536 isoform C [Arachis hypogaea]
MASASNATGSSNNPRSFGSIMRRMNRNRDARLPEWWCRLQVLPSPVRLPKLPPKRKSSKQEKATPGSNNQAATTQLATNGEDTVEESHLWCDGEERRRECAMEKRGEESQLGVRRILLDIFKEKLGSWYNSKFLQEGIGSLDAKVCIWSIPDRHVVDWTDMHEMVAAACYTPDGQLHLNQICWFLQSALVCLRENRVIDDATGLGFHAKSCPKAEKIVSDFVMSTSTMLLHLQLH